MGWRGARDCRHPALTGGPHPGPDSTSAMPAPPSAGERRRSARYRGLDNLECRQLSYQPLGLEAHRDERTDQVDHVARVLMLAQPRVRVVDDAGCLIDLGIDSSNIRSYENGRAMPSIYSLVRIALALTRRRVPPRVPRARRVPAARRAQSELGVPPRRGRGKTSVEGSRTSACRIQSLEHAARRAPARSRGRASVPRTRRLNTARDLSPHQPIGRGAERPRHQPRVRAKGSKSSGRRSTGATEGMPSTRHPGATDSGGSKLAQGSGNRGGVENGRAAPTH